MQTIEETINRIVIELKFQDNMLRKGQALDYEACAYQVIHKLPPRQRILVLRPELEAPHEFIPTMADSLCACTLSVDDNIHRV